MEKIQNKTLLSVLLLSTASLHTAPEYPRTLTEKAQEAAHDVKEATVETAREVKDFVKEGALQVKGAVEKTLAHAQTEHQRRNAQAKRRLAAQHVKEVASETAQVVKEKVREGAQGAKDAVDNAAARAKLAYQEQQLEKDYCPTCGSKSLVACNADSNAPARPARLHAQANARKAVNQAEKGIHQELNKAREKIATTA